MDYKLVTGRPGRRSVLRMLDAYGGRSILVAATNHDGMLDSAVWRRFEEVLFLRRPTAAQIRRLLSVKLRCVRYDFDIKEVVERGWFADATHADVERVVRRAVKAMVLEGGESRLRLDHLDAARRRVLAELQRARRRAETKS